MARKRRTRTAHPGVKLRSRKWKSGKSSCFARWEDPLTGQEVDTNLSRLGLTTAEARRDWAVRKSQELAKVRAAVAAGVATPGPSWSIADAVEDYLTRAAARLEPLTVEGYRASLRPLQEWAEKSGVQTLRDLSPGRLAAFKDVLVRRQKHAPAEGGQRGERRLAESRRSPASINHDLAAIRIFLFEARRLDRLPQIDREAITESLRRVKEHRNRPGFMRPKEVQALLEAALRHDRETFHLTRMEKSGVRPVGTTPKYEPIAPFVMFVLLSGCRLGEALALRWERIYLEGDAPEIHLRPEDTKTRQDRAIDLTVSPSLVALLGAMRVQSGGRPFVFGGDAPLSRNIVEKGRRRLAREFGSPVFRWQNLRQTCDTILNCAPGIYGGAAAWHAAKRLGHSVVVSEQRYAGLIRDLPRDAMTIETALGIDDVAAQILGGLTRLDMPVKIKSAGVV